MNSLNKKGKIHNKEARNTNRQFTSDVLYHGIANKENGDGYLTNKQHAPNTNKQFLSNNEYTGSAKGDHNAQMSYDNTSSGIASLAPKAALVTHCC